MTAATVAPGVTRGGNRSRVLPRPDRGPDHPGRPRRAHRRPAGGVAARHRLLCRTGRAARPARLGAQPARRRPARPRRRPGRRRGPGGRAAAPAPRTRDGRRAALRRRGGGAREGRGRVRLVGPGHPGRRCGARDAGGAGCGVVGRDGREPARRDPARRADAAAARRGRRARARRRGRAGRRPARRPRRRHRCRVRVVLLGPPVGAAHVVVAAAVVVLVAATGPALVDGGDAVFLGLGLTALLPCSAVRSCCSPARRRPVPQPWPHPSRWH